MIAKKIPVANKVIAVISDLAVSSFLQWSTPSQPSFFQVDNFHMNFWPHTNKFYVLKYYINKNISAKPAAILTLGTWWSCSSILPFGKLFLSTYILMLVKPLPLTETTELPD